VASGEADKSKSPPPARRENGRRKPEAGKEAEKAAEKPVKAVRAEKPEPKQTEAADAGSRKRGWWQRKTS
jgi:hypothetical protein